ncbi:Flp family type IVb pilin [Nocardioides sp. ChNu-153]|uniref:Flp family type IVb pilin n=1 Tax=unclassified Nocardioides TaxID=2615069 RepID=UPI002405C844|nr:MULTISPECIES: Flp family type IVb pilin [unclassified Nocardioides]MDF9715918.1 Flp family type IVb pilin [Nocardioides sp. ChNu-99]MDN7122911.1 Flp family type IVb pilin [Nocardioides sp. ChNu-153]
MNPPRKPATRRDQRGATSAEYALLVSLVAVALIAAVLVFGGAVDGLFDTSGSRVSDLP